MNKKNNTTAVKVTFFSKKNAKMRAVYGHAGREVADALEADDTIAQYDTNVDIDPALVSSIDKTGVRLQITESLWTTDFVTVGLDGGRGVIEVAEEKMLEGPHGLAFCERLELSRRYWQRQGVTDWKVAVIEEGGEL